MTPGEPGDAKAGGSRPTSIGPFSAKQGGNRTRSVPPPWIDCPACAWRHYPATDGGRWHIATTCASCGAELPLGGDDDVAAALPDPGSAS